MNQSFKACDWLLITDVTHSCARPPLTQDQAWVDRESWWSASWYQQSRIELVWFCQLRTNPVTQSLFSHYHGTGPWSQPSLKWNKVSLIDCWLTIYVYYYYYLCCTCLMLLDVPIKVRNIYGLQMPHKNGRRWQSVCNFWTTGSTYSNYFVSLDIIFFKSKCYHFRYHFVQTLERAIFKFTQWKLDGCLIGWPDLKWS